MSEEQGTPAHEQKIRQIKQDKIRDAKYKVVSQKEVIENGKILLKMKMSDGSTKQVYKGLAKKKKKLAR